MTKRLIRFLSVTVLWAFVALFLPPATTVVRANGLCACGGYTYAYDYYPYYYSYEGEQSWNGSDYNTTDYGACVQECLYYGTVTIGGTLCNTYGLVGGKGFLEVDFSWYFDDGTTYGGYYGSGQISC